MKHLTAAEKRRALVSALTDSVTTIVERAVLEQVQAFLGGATTEAPRARNAAPAARGRVSAALSKAPTPAPPAARKAAAPKAPPKTSPAAKAARALEKLASSRKEAARATPPRARLETLSPDASLNAAPPRAPRDVAPLKPAQGAPAPLSPAARPTLDTVRAAPVERVQTPKATGHIGSAAERIFGHVQQNPGALGQEARIALGLAFADWRAGVAKLALDGKIRKEGDSLLPRYFVVAAPEPFKAVPPIRRKARVAAEATV